MLQSVTVYYKVLQSNTKYYRILQSVSSASTWTNFWACWSKGGLVDPFMLCMSAAQGTYKYSWGHPCPLQISWLQIIIVLTIKITIFMNMVYMSVVRSLYNPGAMRMEEFFLPAARDSWLIVITRPTLPDPHLMHLVFWDWSRLFPCFWSAVFAFLSVS